MTDRPITFNTEMVRALLDGRKTQTRRVIKPQPPRWVEAMGFTCMTPPGHISGRGNWRDQGPSEKFIKLPYVAGDRLWVREAWKADAQMRYVSPRDMSMGEPIEYVADGARRTTGSRMISAGHYRPPINLPRWASRITLTVKEVRAQRVQDISESDAEAEGVNLRWLEDPAGHEIPASFQCCFMFLWNDITQGVYGWDANPWVTAATFTVEHANIDALPQPD